MDLSKGYFQIPLTPRAQRYAAFVTPFGTYIPKKMMFGLVYAPYYFCKLMAQVLEGLEQFALPYIDDIAIFSQGWKDHVKHIDIVLGRLRKAGLNTIASPLTDALKEKIKKEKITWDEKCGKALEELKAKLVTQPILFAPDFATEFILQTDAMLFERDARNRWRDGPVCPAVDKELWRLGPDGSGVFWRGHGERKDRKKTWRERVREKSPGEREKKRDRKKTWRERVREKRPREREREKEKKTGEKRKSPRESEKDDERRWR
ncbi:retrovirus-related Pol polyprotein from transposon 297 [Trichonephila clavipes]|nr:retrovirus-related Pol polyprotein from transposon 297 [Trichonephila clavipes]